MTAGAAFAIAAQLAAMREAAAAGDGDAAAAAVDALAATPCGPAAVREALAAALDLDHAGFLHAATALCVAADLPPHARTHVAWRLAIAGKAESAMAVLMSEPGIAGVEAVGGQLMAVLHQVAVRSDPRSIAGIQARALSRRLVPAVPPPLLEADRRFAGDPRRPPRAPGPPVALHPAPGLSPLVLAEAQAVLAVLDERVGNEPFPGVRLLRDVYVNRGGQIWGRAGQIYRAINLPLPERSRRAAAGAPELPAAVLAVEAHNNLYHWFAEWLPSIAWRLDDAASDLPVLIRDDAAPFVHASLALGAAGPLPVATAGDAVLVRELYLGDRDLHLLARPDATGGPYARLRERAWQGLPGPAGDAVYISRRDSRKRPMANEAALEAALARRGIEVLEMSHRPLAEQVARVGRAAFVVAPHGAGLALLAAAPPGRRVLEVVPALRGSLQLRACMARISRLVGHEHALWLEAEAPGTPWEVSLDPFLAVLDAMLAKRVPSV